MKAIVDKHIAACVAEIRAEVERQFAQALQGLTTAPVSARKPRRAAKAARRGSARQTRAERVVERAATKAKGRTCGCGPVGRHRRECGLAAQPEPKVTKAPVVARTGNGADSSRVKPLIDEARALRFAKLEAAAKARAGATA